MRLGLVQRRVALVPRTFATGARRRPRKPTPPAVELDAPGVDWLRQEMPRGPALEAFRRAKLHLQRVRAGTATALGGVETPRPQRPYVDRLRETATLIQAGVEVPPAAVRDVVRELHRVGLDAELRAMAHAVCNAETEGAPEAAVGVMQDLVHLGLAPLAASLLLRGPETLLTALPRGFLVEHCDTLVEDGQVGFLTIFIRELDERLRQRPAGLAGELRPNGTEVIRLLRRAGEGFFRDAAPGQVPRDLRDRWWRFVEAMMGFAGPVAKPEETSAVDMELVLGGNARTSDEPPPSILGLAREEAGAGRQEVAAALLCFARMHGAVDLWMLDGDCGWVLDLRGLYSQLLCAGLKAAVHDVRAYRQAHAGLRLQKEAAAARPVPPTHSAAAEDSNAQREHVLVLCRSWDTKEVYDCFQGGRVCDGRVLPVMTLRELDEKMRATYADEIERGQLAWHGYTPSPQQRANSKRQDAAVTTLVVAVEDIE